MSWKTKNCYAEDVLKTSSRPVLKTSLRRLEDQQMFAGRLLGEITKQPLSKFKPQKTWTICNFEGWDLALDTYEKNKYKERPLPKQFL